MSLKLVAGMAAHNRAQLRLRCAKMDSEAFLKAKIAANVIFANPAPNSQKLVYAGRVLGDDAQSLRSAFVADGAAIHMVVTDIAPAPAPHVASAAQGGVG